MKNVMISTLAVVVVLGVSNTAFANNQAKLALAKKVVVSGKISPYATPSLKKLLKQARQIDQQMMELGYYDGLGCEFAEHFFVGQGTDGFGSYGMRNWKASVTSSGAVRATFNTESSAHLIEMSMVCQGNKCQISDVRHGYSDRPKVIPKRTDTSLKNTAEQMVAVNGCAE